MRALGDSLCPKSGSISNSVVQSRPFDLLVFPFWGILSKGPKRLTFCFQALWATEVMLAGQRLFGSIWLGARESRLPKGRTRMKG